MKRRVTRWVTSFGIAVLDGGNVPGMLNCQNTEYRIPITIEYDDGTGEPPPATRERVVEGCADENGRFLYSPHLKCSDSSHRPARLIITEPVVEMTLMAAVDKILRLWRKASDPIETPEMRMLSEAAAREHAKVGK